MDRSPLYLAAVASSAVPGLDPVTVEALPSLPYDRFDVAFVRDTEHRRWVVRAPRTATAGAELESAIAITALLARRVGFSVPGPKGFFDLGDSGRASVYPFLPGDPIDLGEVPDRRGLAGDIGRVMATVHNLDVALADEAGLPSYDADACRTRRLADLDRAATTGRVPTSLLTRWEQALEDVTLWRFAPALVHGALSGDALLVTFDDDDAASGRVRGVVGWEHAQVSDPAEDFAAVVDQASPEVVDRIMEAYAHARLERPDPHLLVRARLLSELDLLHQLTEALARGDDAAVEGLSARLRRLDEVVHALEESSDDYQRLSLTPRSVRSRPAPPPAVDEDEDDDELPGITAPGHLGVEADGPMAAGSDGETVALDEVADDGDANREDEVDDVGGDPRSEATDDATPAHRVGGRAETVEIRLDPQH